MTWIQMNKGKNASSPDYALLGGQVQLLSDSDATNLINAGAAVSLTSTQALALLATNGNAGPNIAE